MGRGIAYPYPHFMLYEADYFQLQFGDENDPQYEFDDSLFKDFINDIKTAFNAYDFNASNGRESDYIAANDYLRIGIDSSGGGPCIFVEPKEDEDENEYDIQEEVKAAFNKLIKQYHKGFFSEATSAWTSRELEVY